MYVCVCVCVYTAIFIFHLCVWTSEVREQRGIYNVKTVCAVTEQISAITVAALFMFYVYCFVITLS
jgi:hypothetical protein